MLISHSGSGISDRGDGVGMEKPVSNERLTVAEGEETGGVISEMDVPTTVADEPDPANDLSGELVEKELDSALEKLDLISLRVRLR